MQIDLVSDPVLRERLKEQKKFADDKYLAYHKFKVPAWIKYLMRDPKKIRTFFINIFENEFEISIENDIVNIYERNLKTVMMRDARTL